MKRIVHISDVIEFKACRRKWSFSSRIQQNLQPIAAYSPFFVGTGVHYCIEHLISDGVAPVTSLAQHLKGVLRDRKATPMWRDEVPEVRRDVLLIRALIEQYKAWTRHNAGPFADTNLDYIAHEVRFDEGLNADWPAVRLEIDGMPLEPEVWLAGRFDGLARRKSDGAVWLVEHKTCRSIQERAKLLPHDEQATAYAYAAGKLFGEPVAGVIYTLLRKKIAAVPREVKGGRLSVDKRIDTSPEVYRKAILEYHGPISEKAIQGIYGETLRYIDDFCEPFVSRVAIQRSKAQIDLYIRELHATALEMYSPNTVAYANRTWTCPKCLFRGPCLARDAGNEVGVTSLLQTQYTQRKLDDPSVIVLEDA